MTNPLLQFDSPRQFANDAANGSAIVQTTTRVALGPGLAATLVPASPLPGEVQTTRLDATGASAAELAATNAALAALTAAVADAVAYGVSGGRWEVPVIYDFTIGPVTLPAVFGAFYRVDASGSGAGETFTLVLPAVTLADVGRKIGIAEVSGTAVGFGSGFGELYVDTTGAQPIDRNIVLPYDTLTGPRPRAVFIAAQMTSGPDTYGWTVESNP